MFGKISRYTGRVRLAQRQSAGTGFYQQTVSMAVITAFKFYDLVTTGITARQTNGTHGGFRTGIHHADHFHIRHDLTDHFGHQYFAFRWCAIT